MLKKEKNSFPKDMIDQFIVLVYNVIYSYFIVVLNNTIIYICINNLKRGVGIYKYLKKNSVGDNT